ncbi:uncharacterized protein BCR38DRAFT_406237 [Pseudomassariella vexata]|uniref:Transmembrane protein n=1 Tax=Pseudomassariella vexata TaxID=1141098 RepID=A0A1Y2E9S1_9PEZI|nr:uncharacterized protein BCR38DRAFT_406237 [Pseudomassariella vexata]ORY68299.1 hypothetical protein BCR38DRAFT_406237 [Pseudomassariella vexata]
MLVIRQDTTSIISSDITTPTSTTTIFTIVTLTTTVPPRGLPTGLVTPSSMATQPTETPPALAPSSPSGLTTEQVVGITVGVIAFVFLLLILVAVFRHKLIRRHHQASIARDRSVDPPSDSLVRETRTPSAFRSFASFVQTIPPMQRPYSNFGEPHSGGSGREPSMQSNDVRIVIQRPNKSRPWNSALWPIPPGYAERFTFLRSSTVLSTASDADGAETTRRHWSLRTEHASSSNTPPVLPVPRGPGGPLSVSSETGTVSGFSGRSLFSSWIGRSL